MEGGSVGCIASQYGEVGSLGRNLEPERSQVFVARGEAKLAAGDRPIYPQGATSTRFQSIPSVGKKPRCVEMWVGAQLTFTGLRGWVGRSPHGFMFSLERV